MQKTTERSNSKERFARLYDDFMPKVFRYVICRVNNRLTAEDLTSTVFEKALNNFERYSEDKAAFSSWIFSITRNTIIDYYRTNSKRQIVSLDEAPDVPSGQLSSQEDVENEAEKKCLRDCLAKLPEKDQEIIRLKFYAELDNRQIARMLGLSESNVGVKLFRAIKRLRADFEDTWNG